MTIPSYAKAGTFNLTAKVSQLAAMQPWATSRSPSQVVQQRTSLASTSRVRQQTQPATSATSPYAVGDQVPYQFVVNSLSNVAVKSVPLTGNFNPLVPADIGGPTAAGNCRFGSVSVWAGYTCGTPRHQVTAAEAGRRLLCSPDHLGSNGLGCNHPELHHHG